MISQCFQLFIVRCTVVLTVLLCAGATRSADEEALRWLDQADALLETTYGTYPARERDGLAQAKTLIERATQARARVEAEAGALSARLATVRTRLEVAEAAHVCSTRLRRIRDQHLREQPAAPRDFDRLARAIHKLRRTAPEARPIADRYAGLQKDLADQDRHLRAVAVDRDQLEQARRARLRARVAVDKSLALLDLARADARAQKDSGALHHVQLSLHDTTLPDAVRSYIAHEAFHVARQLAFAGSDEDAGRSLAALTEGDLLRTARTSSRHNSFTIKAQAGRCYALFTAMGEPQSALIDVRFFRRRGTPGLTPFSSDGGREAGAPRVFGFCSPATFAVRVKTVLSPGASARHAVVAFDPVAFPPHLVARLAVPPPDCAHHRPVVPGTVAYWGKQPVTVVDPGPEGALLVQVVPWGSAEAVQVSRRELSAKPGEKPAPAGAAPGCSAAPAPRPDALAGMRLRYLVDERDATQ